MKRASIAIIAIALLLVVVVSGCVSNCSFDTSSQKKILEAGSINECADLCHKMGILWRTEVSGLGPNHVQCNCYSCG
ncbi:MAG: hypothetical protein NT120_02795 [Candidatus Aenigmarchaeota archaeon]|nr:hypothetical protein [Candidatus Aenigmarchaeota archaeon]